MSISLNHFEIEYQIVASTEKEAREKAEKASVEQSVEMPLSSVPNVAHSSVPDVLSVTKLTGSVWKTTVSFPFSIIGDDIVQFLNVLYGNISLYSDIKVTDISNNILQSLCEGPTFGIDGIRNMIGIDSRPLSCTALKPIGLSPKELASRAALFAKGGIDIIKDDHGLANQSSARFSERTKACADAIRKVTDKTGKQTLYFPNITASPLSIPERVEKALEHGAHGVLICPQLTGLSIISDIRRKYSCPIITHPSFSGSYISHKTCGMSMSLYFGKIWRALGADAVIFPNPGGRFSFSEEETSHLHRTLTDEIFPFKTTFPVPAGGIQLNSVKDFKKLYGNNTIFLIGGSLYEHPDGIEKAAKTFQNALI